MLDFYPVDVEHFDPCHNTVVMINFNCSVISMLKITSYHSSFQSMNCAIVINLQKSDEFPSQTAATLLTKTLT